MVRKITLETDLVESLKVLSNSIHALAEAIQCNSSSNSITVPNESNQINNDSINIEDIRAVLVSKSQNGKQKEVKALIKKFGASKLSEISKDKYPELLEEAKEI